VQFTGLSENDASWQGHSTTQVFAQAAYTLKADGFQAQPYGDIALVEASSGAFEESGGAQSDLSGAEKSDSVTIGTAGVRLLADDITQGDWIFAPRAAIGWQHAFGTVKPGQIVSFAATSQSFQVFGVPLDADAAVLQAGVDVKVGAQGKLSVLYDGLFSAKMHDDTLRAQFGWTF